MKATIHNVQQGTQDWLKLRQSHDTASEAPAALGKSKYQTRSALLKQKSTGLTDEVDGAKQALFDRGHAAEDAARAIAEDLIGEDLFPITATLTVDGVPLLASLDGAAYDGTTIWEHKLYSASLAEDVESGNLDPHYTTQLDQQLLVTGATKCLFMTSDGTTEKLSFCWYYADQSKFDVLIAGWKQFHADLTAYVPSEVIAEAVGRTPETLPALHIVMRGEISESNLADFKQVALTAIRSVNRDLKTDQDFADSAKARKWCEDIETRVAAAKDHALGQTKTIDDLFRTMDEISAEARDVRLALEKLEKARKESRRGEIVAGGIKALNDHIKALNTRLAGDSNRNFMPVTTTDFGSAIKGLRTFDSMQNAVDTTLANAKIIASATADKIQTNLNTLRELASAHAFLFADTAQIVLKAPEDLTMLVKSRIADHQAKEAERIAAETARIAEQERIKAQARADAEIAAATAKARAEAHAQAQVDAEAKRASEDAIAKAQAEHPAVVAAVAQFDEDVRVMLSRAPTQAPEAVLQAALEIFDTRADRDNGATMRLGQITERLGFTVTADFLRTLGFEPCANEKNAKLYKERVFPLICRELVRHIQSVCELQAA